MEDRIRYRKGPEEKSPALRFEKSTGAEFRESSGREETVLPKRSSAGRRMQRYALLQKQAQQSRSPVRDEAPRDRIRTRRKRAAAEEFSVPAVPEKTAPAERPETKTAVPGERTEERTGTRKGSRQPARTRPGPNAEKERTVPGGSVRGQDSSNVRKEPRNAGAAERPEEPGIRPPPRTSEEKKTPERNVPVSAMLPAAAAGGIRKMTGTALHTAGRTVSESLPEEQDDNDALSASQDAAQHVGRPLRRSPSRTGRTSGGNEKELRSTSSRPGLRTKSTATDAAARREEEKRLRKRRQMRPFAEQIRQERAAESAAGPKIPGLRRRSRGRREIRRTVPKRDPFRRMFVILMLVLAGILALSLLSSGLILSAASGNGVVLTTYPSSDEDIWAAENAYRRLEQQLQAQLTTISARYPGYQEYIMDIDEIGHDPYQLISYLTTYHWYFTAEDVEEEIGSLFEEQYELQVTPSVRQRNGRTISVLNVRLINHGLDRVCRDRMDGEQTELYEALNITKGNRSYLFNESNTAYGSAGIVNYRVPEEALSDEQFARMLREAEKYLGWPYVWGGSSPADGGFDCSGYVCWVVNNCGNGWNVGRTTAEGLRRLCAYVSPSEAKPGDLVFFEGTYNTEGASHVGIYVGNGMMINAGDPIKYADLNSPYWQAHFMQFGRLPGANPGTSAGSSSGFTEEDRRLLADCIYWEARGQSFECQCYVGQVILNRVYDSRYPNTIRGVIGQAGQYANGIRSSPDPCYEAADAVLTGQVAMPRNVIYQAQFQQGSGVWKYLEGEYFCYG